MSEIIVSSLRQLAWHSPELLVYLVGIVLALVFRRRYPGPCLFMLVATVLLLVVTITQILGTQYLWRAKDELDWDYSKLGRILSSVSLSANSLRAIGLGLLLAAVLFRRRPGVPTQDVARSDREAQERSHIPLWGKWTWIAVAGVLLFAVGIILSWHGERRRQEMSRHERESQRIASQLDDNMRGVRWRDLAARAKRASQLEQQLRMQDHRSAVEREGVERLQVLSRALMIAGLCVLVSEALYIVLARRRSRRRPSLPPSS
jgi:hypothetical protein